MWALLAPVSVTMQMSDVVFRKGSDGFESKYRSENSGGGGGVGGWGGGTGLNKILGFRLFLISPAVTEEAHFHHATDLGAFLPSLVFPPFFFSGCAGWGFFHPSFSTPLFLLILLRLLPSSGAEWVICSYFCQISDGNAGEK